MDGGGRTAHIDHPQHLTGPRVLDRCTGTGPRMMTAHEVLGREHLHRTTGHQCRTNRVGPHRALGPVGTLDESESVRAREHLRRSAPPQHVPVGIRDDQDVVAVGDQRVEATCQLVHDLRQAGASAAFFELLELKRPFPGAVHVRVETGTSESLPRVVDDAPRTRRHAPARHRRVVNRAENGRELARIVAGVDRGLQLGGRLVSVHLFDCASRHRRRQRTPPLATPCNPCRHPAPGRLLSTTRCVPHHVRGAHFEEAS